MGNLMANVRLAMDRFHTERLKLIDEFDYSKVMRKAAEDLREKGVRVDREYLDGGIEALKQYYAVALLDPDNMHAVSEAVDPFWHSHILHTRDYMAYCQQIFGQFIHHSPLDRSDTRQVDRVQKLYAYTYSIYQQMFRRIDSAWWPEPREARMICTHYRVTDPAVLAHALFSRDSVTDLCELHEIAA